MNIDFFFGKSAAFFLQIVSIYSYFTFGVMYVSIQTTLSRNVVLYSPISTCHQFAFSYLPRYYLIPWHIKMVKVCFISMLTSDMFVCIIHQYYTAVSIPWILSNYSHTRIGDAQLNKCVGIFPPAIWYGKVQSIHSDMQSLERDSALSSVAGAPE